MSEPGRTVFDEHAWAHYRTVNARFARHISAEATPGAVIWLHDYNPWLVPGLLRAIRPPQVRSRRVLSRTGGPALRQDTATQASSPCGSGFPRKSHRGGCTEVSVWTTTACDARATAASSGCGTARWPGARHRTAAGAGEPVLSGHLEVRLPGAG